MIDEADPADAHTDTPPRRFGPVAIATTGAVLAVAASLALLVVRHVPPPIDALPAVDPVAPTFVAFAPAATPTTPKLARNFDPDMAARQAGILGMVEQESGHFLASPYGGAFATGQDDEDVWGGLTGTEIGESAGLGGLGIIGSGRGGGGTGEGLIGMGHGMGSGTGQGFGRRGMRMAMPNMRPLAESTADENYDRIDEHRFVSVADDARSTFSIDVDTASYSNVRRFLEHGQLPPPDAVRVEEFVNYFGYDYEPPADGNPFAVASEVAECPWNRDHLLVRLGLQGQVFDHADLPPRNFVFLIDVSGSMADSDRLPLVRQALDLLVDDLRPKDRVGIVVYAGASGVVLDPTSGDDKAAIRRALDRLQGGGSTNGGAGIELAYRLATRHFVEGGANRVILATDGDFNVGTTGRRALNELIEKKRASGVFLSVLGVGRGNLQDATMESLADKGNGNYAYLDSIDEARKVLVDEAAATLVTIAKDVKIQVEFDPTEVRSWRLVGYENRKLAHRDFADDTKDAGEIGAGHSVTALYEIVPAHGVDARSNPLMKVALRWKAPQGDTSTAIEHTVASDARSLAASSDDFRLAAAAAQFGMLLRNSEVRGDATWVNTLALAQGALRRVASPSAVPRPSSVPRPSDGPDATDAHACERVELVDLVSRAADLHGARIDRRAVLTTTAQTRARCRRA